MILKYLVKSDDGACGWNYHSDVKDASVRYDDKTKCTHVRVVEANDVHYDLVIQGTAYLLNDSGKTIERIAV